MTRVTLVGAVALLLALPASAAYRNPTAGSEVVLQLPGMHRAQVNRGVVYRRVGRSPLRMDVYRPRGTARSRRLPVVLIGGAASARAGRDTGQKMGWGQLVATSGLAAAVFDTRSESFLRTPAAPSADVAAAIRFVRARGARLGLDPNRICTLGFSVGTAPWHLHAAMREPQPYIRCNAVYYGPFDFEELAEEFSVDRASLRPYEAISYLRERGAAIPPLLVAKAGRDGAAINNPIDRFAAEARRLGAPVEVVTHPTGPHAFDVRTRDATSRRIIRRTLSFFRERLLAPSLAAVEARPRPLRLFEPCVTRAERRGVVRFLAADSTRLIGVLLGAGPRGVVLAHQGGGGAPPDLCAWIPYARTLARSGYRVLIFDHRTFGSSGRPRVVSRYGRVDLDVIGAVRLLRARGVTRVVLGGASLGGAAVVGGAAAIAPPVDGVFTIGGTHTFGGIDARAAARRLTMPALFVAAEEDGGGRFAEEARELHEAAASPDKRLAIFPGIAHGAPQLRSRPVRELVDGWIRERMAP